MRSTRLCLCVGNVFLFLFEYDVLLLEDKSELWTKSVLNREMLDIFLCVCYKCAFGIITSSFLISCILNEYTYEY